MDNVQFVENRMHSFVMQSAKLSECGFYGEPIHTFENLAATNMGVMSSPQINGSAPNLIPELRSCGNYDVQFAGKGSRSRGALGVSSMSVVLHRATPG
jgi:hypothetical protein